MYVGDTWVRYSSFGDELSLKIVYSDAYVRSVENSARTLKYHYMLLSSYSKMADLAFALYCPATM